MGCGNILAFDRGNQEKDVPPPILTLKPTPPPQSPSDAISTSTCSSDGTLIAAIISTKDNGSTGERRKTLTQNIVSINQGKRIQDFYEVHDDNVLGSGISGQVKLCAHIETGRQYALKVLSKKMLKDETLADLKAEINIMASLDHPNIVRIVEYFESKYSIYLILELLSGGELLDRLYEQKDFHYSEKIACRHIHTILNAINHCHRHNIAHRDLKLENFLFESRSDDAQLKLIDFGLSQYFQPEQIMHKAVGTPYYVAPEVMEGSYTAKCDIWSLGVITYMLLSGTPPFSGSTDAETIEAVRRGQWSFDPEHFSMVSDDAKHFIEQCLTRQVSLRPSAHQLVGHSWFDILLVGDDQLDMHHHHHPSLDIIRRLNQFVKRSYFVKICMDVVAHTLLPDQLTDLREEFLKFDVSNTGDISFADLRAVLEQYPGFKEEGLVSVFYGLDIEQTGCISYHEFLAATLSRRKITEANWRIAFELMSNHAEHITAEDIKQLLGDGAMDVDSLMSEVGLSKDTRIDFSHFKSILIAELNSPGPNSTSYSPIGLSKQLKRLPPTKIGKPARFSLGNSRTAPSPQLSDPGMDDAVEVRRPTKGGDDLIYVQL